MCWSSQIIKINSGGTQASSLPCDINFYVFDNNGFSSTNARCFCTKLRLSNETGISVTTNALWIPYSAATSIDSYPNAASDIFNYPSSSIVSRATSGFVTTMLSGAPCSSSVFTLGGTQNISANTLHTVSYVRDAAYGLFVCRPLTSNVVLNNYISGSAYASMKVELAFSSSTAISSSTTLDFPNCDIIKLGTNYHVCATKIITASQMSQGTPVWKIKECKIAGYQRYTASPPTWRTLQTASVSANTWSSALLSATGSTNTSTGKTAILGVNPYIGASLNVFYADSAGTVGAKYYEERDMVVRTVSALGQTTGLISTTGANKDFQTIDTKRGLTSLVYVTSSTLVSKAKYAEFYTPSEYMLKSSDIASNYKTGNHNLISAITYQFIGGSTVRPLSVSIPSQTATLLPICYYNLLVTDSAMPATSKIIKSPVAVWTNSSGITPQLYCGGRISIPTSGYSNAITAYVNAAGIVPELNYDSNSITSLNQSMHGILPSDSPGFYIDTNNTWQGGTFEFENIYDSGLYNKANLIYGPYESYCSANVKTGLTMYVHFKGYNRFTIYVGKSGNTAHKIIVSKPNDLNTTFYSTTTNTGPNLMKNYTKVVFSGLSYDTVYTVSITYSRTTTATAGPNRGFMFIPVFQPQDISGRYDFDYTYV